MVDRSIFARIFLLEALCYVATFVSGTNVINFSTSKSAAEGIGAVSNETVGVRLSYISLYQKDVLTILNSKNHVVSTHTGPIIDSAVVLLEGGGQLNLNANKDINATRYVLGEYNTDCVFNVIADVIQPITISFPKFLNRTMSSNETIKYVTVITSLADGNGTVPKAPADLYLSFKSVSLVGSTAVTVTGNDGQSVKITSVQDVHIQSDAANVTVEFDINTAPSVVEGIAFKINSECRQEMNLRLGEDLVITPYRSTMFEDCYWHVTSPVNSTIVAQLGANAVLSNSSLFFIHDGNSINNKRLRVYDPVLIQAGVTDGFVVSSGNGMMVHFFSTDCLKDTCDFSLTLHAQTNGGEFVANAEGSTFTFNSKLLSHADRAIYHITAPSKQQIIELDFTTLNLSTDANVTIYDGFDMNKLHHLVSFGKGAVSHPVTSTRNHLTIVAEKLGSDDAFVGSFRTTSVGCNKLSTGFIDTAYFNASLNCSYVVPKAVVGHKGQLRFALSIESLIPGDMVTVLETVDATSKELRMKLNSTLNGRQVSFQFTSKNGGIVKLDSVQETRQSIPVLKIFYEYIQDDECHQTHTDVNTSLILTSPLYPSSYPLLALCSYILKAVNSKRFFWVEFVQLDLVDTHNIKLSSTQNTKDIGVYRGNVLPDDVITVDSTLAVNFDSTGNSKKYGSGHGFKITVTPLDAGGNSTNPSGKLELGNPSVEVRTTAVWIINIPDVSANGSVQIIALNLVHGNLTDNRMLLEIRDGGSVRDQLIPYGNMTDFDQHFLTRTNKLFVKYEFKPSDKVKVGYGFSLNYTTFVCALSCSTFKHLCMHPEWRCNGKNDCGDGSDEIGCVAPPPPAPPGPPEHRSASVPVSVFIITVFAMLTVGSLLGVYGPVAYRRIRLGAGAGYREFRDLGPVA